MAILIHCVPNIAWHRPMAEALQTGLANIGIGSAITSKRERGSDIAILLGTTCFRKIEADGRYLLVDRASIGDPNYVQLVWDGHGRRGNHCIPDDKGDRGRQIFANVQLQPWQTTGPRVVLCGQTETYSPHYKTLEQWYGEVLEQIPVTHFRKHPAGDNPTGLPTTKDWHDAGLVITLNSSVAVDAVINGHPTITMDEASMAWDVSSHRLNIQTIRERHAWLDWLAWTQWHIDEIKSGTPIKHLFEAI